MDGRLNRLDNVFRKSDAPAQVLGFYPRTEGGQFVLVDAQGNKFWFADTTSGAVSISLPEAKVSFGLRFTVKRLTGGANALTVSSVSGNIDGASSHSIPLQYQSFNYTSDGTNFWIW